MASKALEIYTSVPKRHNCAQAVIEGLGFPERVPEMAAFGGGRAPDGTCGALYAAMSALPEADREALACEFRAELGATRCRELKAAGVPCPSCVDCAARLAERHRGA